MLLYLPSSVSVHQAWIEEGYSPELTTVPGPLESLGYQEYRAAAAQGQPVNKPRVIALAPSWC